MSPSVMFPPVRTVFDTAHPYFDHHRVMGQKILPGSAYLKLIVDEFGGLVDRASPARVTDFVWIRPVLQLDAPTTIELHRIPGPAGIAVQILHRGELCARGHVETSSPGRATPVAISRTAFELGVMRYERRLTGARLYEKFAEMGIAYGRMFTCIDSVLIAGRMSLAFLSYPEGGVDLTALFDGAFQSGMALSIDQDKTGLMPFSLGRLIVHQTVGSDRSQFIVLTRKDSEFRTNLSVFDQNMVPLLSVVDLGVRSQKFTETVRFS